MFKKRYFYFTKEIEYVTGKKNPITTTFKKGNQISVDVGQVTCHSFVKLRSGIEIVDLFELHGCYFNTNIIIEYYFYNRIIEVLPDGFGKCIFND